MNLRRLAVRLAAACLLVAVAAPDAWFTYYYWLDDARAPDFARTVDIHHKPGYDPVELIFDQGFGDLFVIRVAGNVVSTDVVGSIAYAIAHLHTRLLVVLGHEGCGAVTAAFLTAESSTFSWPLGSTISFPPYATRK